MADGSGRSAGALGIERRSIDVIPEAERHGSVRSLFTLWFGANMQITAIVTGALGVLLGLPLPWALLALLIGNLFGGIFMALHSAQGPKLGIPQMIQSRAQFGFYGAILPLVLVLIMYLGFFASSAVLGGEALAGIFGWNTSLCIAIVSAVCTLLAVYGYRLIHAYEGILSVIAAIVFLVLTISLLVAHPLGPVWHLSGATGGAFLLVVAIAATWQITYAPYVADYSRYLPSRTGIGAAFWWTYGGSVIASVWMMWLGASATAVIAPKDGAGVSSIVGLTPAHLGDIVAVVLVLGVIAANTLNLYGMFMSATTTITALAPITVHRGVRAAFVLVAAIVGTVIAIAGQGNFVADYSNFILFLAYFLIPWTAINLVDFYAVRRERYDLAAIFQPNGRYGRVSWRAMVAYFGGVAVEIPFINSTFFVGPMVSRLGGADVSWILGLIVSAVLYFLLCRVGAGAPVREYA
ncbi:MAG: purine-cytosine permease family protein [Candidatus Dormibacteraceae bacterium]